MKLEECRRKLAETEAIGRAVSFGPGKAKIKAHAEALRLECAKLEAKVAGAG